MPKPVVDLPVNWKVNNGSDDRELAKLTDTKALGLRGPSRLWREPSI
jgi:hypothetical protein